LQEKQQTVPVQIGMIVALINPLSFCPRPDPPGV